MNLKRVLAIDPALSDLQEAGHNLEIRDMYLLVHGVCYLNEADDVKTDGILFLGLNLDTNGGPIHPDSGDHTIFFAGEQPRRKGGGKISVLGITTQANVLSGISNSHQLSARPDRYDQEQWFKKYSDKIKHYVDLISRHVGNEEDCQQARTGMDEVVLSQSHDTYDWRPYFRYPDMHSMRHGTTIINYRPKDQKIAIIGLGGTGSYILDLLAKNPIAEIHIYDDDCLKIHNAFRSPGAADKLILDKKPKKVAYYKTAYSKMNKRIQSHAYKITEANLHKLDDKNFVFLCLDQNGAKARIAILKHLIEKKDTIC